MKILSAHGGKEVDDAWRLSRAIEAASRRISPDALEAFEDAVARSFLDAAAAGAMETHRTRAAARRHAQGVQNVTKTRTEALREPAESQFAAELAALAAADTRERPPKWLLSPWAVADLRDGRDARRRHGHLAEIRRPQAAHRDCRRDARHGSRAAHPRCPGHGQELGERAHRGGDQRRFHAPRAGNGRHAGGSHPLRLELRAAARQGTDHSTRWFRAPSCAE